MVFSWLLLASLMTWPLWEQLAGWAFLYCRSLGSSSRWKTPISCPPVQPARTLWSISSRTGHVSECCSKLPKFGTFLPPQWRRASGALVRVRWRNTASSFKEIKISRWRVPRVCSSKKNISFEALEPKHTLQSFCRVRASFLCSSIDRFSSQSHERKQANCF